MVNVANERTRETAKTRLKVNGYDLGRKRGDKKEKLLTRKKDPRVGKRNGSETRDEP